MMYRPACADSAAKYSTIHAKQVHRQGDNPSCVNTGGLETMKRHPTPTTTIGRETIGELCDACRA